MFSFHQKYQHHFRWLSVLGIIFFTIIFSILSAYFIFEKKYQNKIYPNVFLDKINLGGLSKDVATKLINEKINQINQNGLTFYYNTDKASLYPLVSSIESDLAYQIIYFDTEKTINTALNYGRNESFFNNLLVKITALSYKYQIAMNYTVNDGEVEKFLNDNFKKFETVAKDAELSYQIDKESKSISLEIKEESRGQIININKAKSDLHERLNNLKTEAIELGTETSYPQINKTDVLNIETMAQRFYKKMPIFLKYKNNKWTLNKEDILPWLQLKSSTEDNEKNIFIGLDSDKIKDYLTTTIAPKVNKEAIEPKFTITNGKVSEFGTGQEGIILDIEANTKKIEFFLSNEEENQDLEIITEIKKALSASEIENLGIKELIGTGHSNFTGSPKNRVHNIKTGTSAVNGTIIKPREEFSLVATLGKINKESGYLPELVIKNNKTVPEYGGGLCQVGTTVFRGTIKAGLPVTARRNHSYRVSYYEPAGTDATIYDPWPDYKFQNDTNNHILILSRVEGYNLYFDFWGTKDGRIATSTYPKIYNIVKPAPTKIIETDTLKPGEKKCTEHAHNGADAYFDYKVTYPPIGTSTEPTIKNTRFKSHYVPWQEVCLIGVDPNKTKATSTEAVIKK
jgi:vancomycin resistance protein YoaR